ncbi:DUF4270 family protein [uncultured Sphingobacterium sp.]|uniref:DUF4270 family protein n=1 Tax=uncultured Sphingobacterium sp. TaxID=182688 RepID=UPI0025FF7391|nr:DUF4270 family protein [uncultured Sphingobacterium sp.]
MIKDFKRRSIQFLLPLFTLAAFVACNKDVSLSLDSSRNETIGLVPIDSVSVKVSTYQLNMVPSSATGMILVGKNKNDITGNVKSTSYMRLGIGTINSAILPDDAVLDSVSLVMPLNKYYYGDTTQMQKISVHRVSEDIVQTQLDPTKPIYERPYYLPSLSIASTKKFAYETNKLAEISFRPRVKSIDSLHFRFNDVISNELFSLIKNKDNRISNSSSFQEYFKGLALVPDAGNTTMIGLKDTIYLQVHYSFMNAQGAKTSGKQYFNIDNRGFQYNHVEADRSATKFASLTLSNPEVASGQTDGHTFIEGSTGVVAKIEFPTLLQLVNDPTIAINKAELVIEAENSAQTNFAQPRSLVLMIANSLGNPIGLLHPPFGNPNEVQQAVAVSDNTNYGKYTFNLIEYLTKFKTTYKNTSLYVSLPLQNLFATGDRLILSKQGNEPKIKLNILYTKFQ